MSALIIGMAAPLAAQTQDASFGPTVRWQQDDGSALWLGTDVAIGDHGATVIAAKELNQPLISVYSALAGDPLFDHDVPDARQIRVAAAAEGTTLAAMVQHFRLPGSLDNFQPELWVWEDAADPEPAWTIRFPEAHYSYYKGMDVHVSADGQSIVAWYSYLLTRRVDIRVYELDGTLRSSVEAWQPVNSSAGEQASITPDASRMLMDVGGHVRVIDLQTGETLHGTASDVALDDDGSHAAILIDSWGPSETLDLVVLDLAGGQELDFVTFYSQDNYSDVNATGLMMTADAGTIVGSTWGDFAGNMPDAFAYTLGQGITAELHTAGSAFACDMDPSGQVMVIATKDKHANTPGAGGDIACAETRPAALRAIGSPRLGNQLRLELEAPYTQAWLIASAALGTSPTPWGPSQLDLGTTLNRQLVALQGGQAQWHEALPTTPAAVGQAIHLQAGFLDDGRPAGALTNRISFRIQP
jgi:hypothetical protein